jgi:hypothetical protein
MESVDVAVIGAGPERIGVLHWAGTETAAVWNGYLDGSVRSGHRAGNEIHAAPASDVARVVAPAATRSHALVGSSSDLHDREDGR